MLELNDVLNYNVLNMRHKDHFVVILKSPLGCFTLGEYRFHAWITGELDLSSYVYTNKCLTELVKPIKIKKCEYDLYKLYIDNESLQMEIYFMEDRDYNKRLVKEKIR